jgi:hypothetical protein
LHRGNEFPVCPRHSPEPIAPARRCSVTLKTKNAWEVVVAERWADPVQQAMQRHTGRGFVLPKQPQVPRRPDAEKSPPIQPSAPQGGEPPCQAEPGKQD